MAKASSLPPAVQLRLAAEAGISGVRSRAGPPAAATAKTSPPVAPWSLIKPPMKAISRPSGDQRGLAI